jgi:hypothetical protein
MQIDIVIPACGEDVTLGSLLCAILADGDNLTLDVIVSLNGERQNLMQETAANFVRSFEAAGHTLQIISVTERSKTAALNAADAVRCGKTVLYCDADVIFWPGTLIALARALDVDEPRLAGPRREVIRPSGLLERGYAKVWQALPQVNTFVGAGCYAVNAAGRERWGQFPSIIGDDAFVHSRFASAERIIPADAVIWFELPEKRALFQSVRRWREGNQQIRNLYGVGPEQGAAQNCVTFDISSLLCLPAFLAVQLLSKFVPSPVRQAGWIPTRKAQHIAATPQEIKIRVIVVTFNSAEFLRTLLDSLISKWAKLEIVVVDNASADNSVKISENSAVVSRVIKNDRNLGFGAAVNQAANLAGDFDFILLCNPDGLAMEGSVDQLLSLSLKVRPSVVGAQMVSAEGKPDLTSALARPGYVHAFCFAIGTSAWPMLNWLDPDSRANRGPFDTKDVPVLTGAFCLIGKPLWDELGGFDPYFFLYGEDADLCVRATELGARILSTGTARFLHVGGGSSPNNSERMLRILAGKCDLYRKYAPRLGSLSLLVGCAVRATAEPIIGKDRVWRNCWRRRADWARR